MQVPLMRGDKIDDTVDYRDALPVNMYAVNKPIRGAQGYMNQWYGLTEVSQGFGVDRGGVWVSNKDLEGHYRASGTKLISVNPDGTVTNLGNIGGSGRCSFAYSFNNLAVVSSGKLYYYNPSDGLRQISGENFSAPIDVVWADNLFILTDGENVYHSNPLNEEEFLPLDFVNPQFRPDPSLGLGINEDNELLVFGRFTVEPYRNVGSENFSYQRIASKFLKLGCSGTHARSEMNGFWYVIGSRKETSPAIHQIRSGGEQKISTREIDKLLRGYSSEELSDAVVDCMMIDNVKMIVFTLSRHTILYNESIAESMGSLNAWSILKSDTLGDRPFRGVGFVRDRNLNEWVCGDRNNATIGFLDDSTATQYGEIAEIELYTPLLPIESLSIDSIELNTIAGFAPDEDATVAISLTYEGLFYGKEWWNLYTQNLSYGQRFIARRLGFVREDVSIKLRANSRSRMNFSFMNLEAS